MLMHFYVNTKISVPHLNINRLTNIGIKKTINHLLKDIRMRGARPIDPVA